MSEPAVASKQNSTDRPSTPCSPSHCLRPFQAQLGSGSGPGHWHCMGIGDYCNILWYILGVIADNGNEMDRLQYLTSEGQKDVQGNN